jgi:carboxypeptidase C (cathepsin A)
MTDDSKAAEARSTEPKAAEPPRPPIYPPDSETEHSLPLNDETLRYRVRAGTLPIVSAESGEPEAHIFYTAYTVVDGGADGGGDRPLLFAFNGGPGSSSVWLHLGALGPRRVALNDDGSMPAPPFRLVENPLTWLRFADLVFVDPVGTGFSRPVKPELSTKFSGIKGDLDSLSQFIRLYLSRSGRWGSPLFLAGESYGTFRGAGLAGRLIDQGIAFNGLLLISTTLNLQSLEFAPGNDLPPLVYVPSYAATAWYHQRLPADLQARPLRDVLDEVEAWTRDEYSVALLHGDRLSPARRRAVASRLARYTGLDRRYVELADLRIEIMRFCKELLRTRRTTVGRLDSRLTGVEIDHLAAAPEFDPSYAAILPAYTTLINRYLITDLNYRTDLEYRVLEMQVNEKWDWGSAQNGYPDTSRLLAAALARNPHLRVFLAQGYYDLATPYYAAYHTLAHMGLHDSQRARIQTAEYEAGHMMYIETRSLDKLQADAGAFIRAALNG